MNWLHARKVSFWFLRRRIYRGIRSAALLITILLTCSIVYYARYKSSDYEYQVPIEKTPYLVGIFSPDSDGGLTSMSSLKANKEHFDLVSYYVPWGSQPQSFLPLARIDSAYRIGAIPMITWEPWQNLFGKLPARDQSIKDEKVFAKIVSGQYDHYIVEFANQIKSLKRPVFVRFAHEADNPAYPWSPAGNNSAEEFKAAWKYLHRLFADHQVYNVIWVWNPWKSEAVSSYFPGDSYVDWIGVTSLNYASALTDPAWRSMEDLYRPFHRLPVFRMGIPVMLAEMGSLNAGEQQSSWFKEGFSAMKAKFPEVKGFVLFNNAFDKNVPLNNHNMVQTLNWKIRDMEVLNDISADRDTMISPTPLLMGLSGQKRNVHSPIISIGRNVRGVNYTKGQDWQESSRAFTIPEMIADFKEMKRIGLNTIKWTGPGIYERNILSSAEKMDINIQYSYWISEKIDFVKDVDKLKALHDRILKSVGDLKDEEKITTWNIGNPVLQKLTLSYVKPALLYQQDAYLIWLRKLVEDIKKMDQKRALTIDIGFAKDAPEILKRIQGIIPEIDSYGLVSMGKGDSIRLQDMKGPYFFSSVSAPDYLKMNAKETGVFLTDWQDSQSASLVEFDGLKDHWGRSKISLFQLANRWKCGRAPKIVRKIKILRPSMATLPGEALVYHAIEPANDGWRLVDPVTTELKLEWKLIHTNPYGQPDAITDIGTGPVLKLVIPENPSAYQLYLYIIKDNVVVDIVVSTLNTPLLYPRKGEL